jgi:hypothetical protein
VSACSALVVEQPVAEHDGADASSSSTVAATSIRRGYTAAVPVTKCSIATSTEVPTEVPTEVLTGSTGVIRIVVAAPVGSTATQTVMAGETKRWTDGWSSSSIVVNEPVPFGPLIQKNCSASRASHCPPSSANTPVWSTVGAGVPWGRRRCRSSWLCTSSRRLTSPASRAERAATSSWASVAWARRR